MVCDITRLSFSSGQLLHVCKSTSFICLFLLQVLLFIAMLPVYLNLIQFDGIFSSYPADKSSVGCFYWFHILLHSVQVVHKLGDHCSSECQGQVIISSCDNFNRVWKVVVSTTSLRSRLPGRPRM